MTGGALSVFGGGAGFGKRIPVPRFAQFGVESTRTSGRSSTPDMRTRRPPSILRFVFLLLVGIGSVGCDPSGPGKRESPESADAAPSGPVRVAVTQHFEFWPGPKTESVSYTVLVPRDLAGKQKVVKVDYSVLPARVVERSGNLYAIFEFESPGERVAFSIDTEVDLLPFDQASRESLARPGRSPDPAGSEMNRWLAPEERIEADDPGIRSLANAIPAGTPTEEARAIVLRVAETLSYEGYLEASGGARSALAEGVGDCTDFSDLFVALCRARGIPARTCDGILALPPEPGDTAKHSWVEYFDGSVGWVRVDPLLAGIGREAFDRLPNAYIELSRIRNDALLDGYGFYCYRYQGDEIRADSKVAVRRAGR